MLCCDVLLMDVQVFNGALPDLVTSSFAAKFLLTLSAANLGEPFPGAGPDDCHGFSLILSSCSLIFFLLLFVVLQLV